MERCGLPEGWLGAKRRPQGDLAVAIGGDRRARWRRRTAGCAMAVDVGCADRDDPARGAAADRLARRKSAVVGLPAAAGRLPSPSGARGATPCCAESGAGFRLGLLGLVAAALAVAAVAGAQPRPAAPLPPGAPAPPDAPRPNVVLFLVDDLGHEALGAYGGVSYDTPRLDRLADSGMRFTHAYAQPLCSPSRVKIMTGRYNRRNYTEWGVLPPGEITFANLLRDAGYATFAAGKWQLTGHELLWPVEEPCCLGEGQTPEEAGFDDYLLWYLHGKGRRYADPQLWNRDGGAVVAGGYGPDLLADFVLEKIAEQAAERPEQPFLAYFPMVLTHAPFEPTPASPAWSVDRRARDPAHFADMVAHADAIVGRIVGTLDRLGIRDETLVLFTADNGTPRQITSRMADGRTVRGGKGRTTDAGTRVPFIASWPGTIEAGAVSDALIDLSDFLPSLAELAGAPLPGDRVVDGRSFVPVLRGEQETARDWVFTDFRPRFPRFSDAAFVQDRRFKLYEDGRFFDVAADVTERHPLPAESLSGDAASARAALQAVLDRLAE